MRLAYPVHPRVCGEHASKVLCFAPSSGSSPRVRGTPPSRDSRSSLTSVHPRVCGEHRAGCAGTWQFSGSSPRVRGTLFLNALHVLKVRFIPACAGNTAAGCVCCMMYAVHPRVCGEHTVEQRSAALAAGSSPRVRGTPRTCDRNSPRQRFIPACAGNTNNTNKTIYTYPVHPRVCGEHLPAHGRALKNSGSSPRVRGTLGSMRFASRSIRFIPACAGNTFAGQHGANTEAVHPRVCGEHARIWGIRQFQFGSSPRVRGTLIKINPP